MNGASLTLGLLGAAALASAHRGARALALGPLRRRQLDGMAADLQALAESASNFGSTLRLDELRSWAARHQVAYVGHSGARALLSVPEGLLKVELTSPPYLSNAREFELYRGAPASLARHLQPIDASAFDHAWILMSDFDVLGSLEQIPGYARDELRGAGLAVLRNGDFTSEKKAHTYDTVSDARRRQQVLERGRTERARQGSRATSWIDYSGLHKHEETPQLDLVQTISWPRFLQAVEGGRGGDRVLWVRGARTHLQLKDIQDLLTGPLGASPAQWEGRLRYLHLSLQEAAQAASTLTFPLTVYGGVRLAPHVQVWSEDKAAAQRAVRAPQAGQISKATDVNWTKTLRAYWIEAMGRRGEAPEGLRLYGKVSRS